MLPTYIPYTENIPREYYSEPSTSHLDGTNIYKDRTQKIHLSSSEQNELTSKLYALIKQKMEVHSCSVDQLTNGDFKHILDELHSKLSDQCSKKLNLAGFKTVSYLSVYSFSRAKDKISALTEFLSIDDTRLQLKNLTLKAMAGGKFKAIEQTGHNCKITALAMVSGFLNPKTAIPLHKNSSALTSIRSLAKQKVNSVQGEILSVQALITLAKESKLNDANAVKPGSLKEYRKNVISSLEQNKPVIAFFLVNTDSGWEGGLPIVNGTHVSAKKRASNEHACVITGYEPGTDQITITHWGKNYKTTLSDLYKSSQLLNDARTEESYYKYTNDEKARTPSAKKMKWNSSDRVNQDHRILAHRRTLVEHTIANPQQLNDGFNGTLITF